MLATIFTSSCGDSGEKTSEKNDTTAAAMMAPPKGLDPHAISYRTAQDDIDSFKTHFRKTSNNADVSNVESIDLNALTELINNFNQGVPDVTRGLRVSYAFQNNKVLFLYSAIIKDASGNSTIDNNYSKWNGTAFETVSQNDADALIAAYKNSVDVRRGTDNVWTHIKDNWDETANSNAHSNMMSLEELTGVAADNGNATTLYFFSSSRLDNNIYKHDVLVSPVETINPSQQQGTTGFGNSADDVHVLCPPNCAI